MSGHTPGPWKIGRSGHMADCGFTLIRDPKDFIVAESWPGDQQMENARLIAAAPELLAGCKAALGAFERNDCINWDDLRRAIAKAEGVSEPPASGS